MYQAQFERPPGEELPTEPTEQRAVEEEQPRPVEIVTDVKEPEPVEAPPAMATAVERTLRVEQPLYIAEFTTRGAGIQRWELRRYDHGRAGDHAPIVITRERKPVGTTLLTPFLELGLGDLAQAVFEVESEDERTVAFRYRHSGVTVRKTYLLDEDSYSFRLRVEVENASQLATGCQTPP